MSSSSSTPPPPLLGDGQGNYRVHIVGNSGAGKTTTGAALAAILGVPFIPMDTLFWNPGWKESTTEELHAKLRAALAQSGRGWVADGNYDSRGGGPLVMEHATDIIWLDPPLYIYFPRILLRTIKRLLRIGTPCAPGCDEQLGEVLSKKGILWWCLSNHAKCRARNQERMRLWGLQEGTDPEVGRRRMRRFGGWGGDVWAWLREVEEMVGGRKAKAD